jgi:hypothetical protein
MAQAVSLQPLTGRGPFLFQASPCGIFGVQNGTETGYPPSISTAMVILTIFHAHSFTDYRRYIY